MQIANQNLQTANQNQFWLAVPANQFFWSKLSPEIPPYKSGERLFMMLTCLVIVLLYQCRSIRSDNTNSKRYKAPRSPSHKVPSVAFKIVVGRLPLVVCVALVQGLGASDNAQMCVLYAL